jgi:nicotinate-nucleotide adenylyltransferase
LRIAIFGGTFDPIHDAHLAIARLAADCFHLDRVLFVPANAPPHKRGGAQASYLDRLRMVELACAAETRFEASRLEEGTERSYSIDTIEKLRPRLSALDELYFLIGADAFAEIRTWRRWTDVAKAVRFIVVSRPGYAYEIPEGVMVDRLDSVALLDSSSEIRAALARGKTPGGLPAPVCAYIAEHGLYQAA